MATITVRETSPMADMKRKKLMAAINALNDTELNNLGQLLDSPKARGYLGNNVKFQGLKMFI